MTVGLYTIKDELSEYSTMIMPFQEDAHAKRWFRDYVENNSMLKKNPEDFSLWKFATYETKTADIVPVFPPELIERAKGEYTENGN